jgi:hypothetical protein
VVSLKTPKLLEIEWSDVGEEAIPRASLPQSKVKEENPADPTLILSEKCKILDDIASSKRLCFTVQ